MHVFRPTSSRQRNRSMRSKTPDARRFTSTASAARRRAGPGIGQVPCGASAGRYSRHLGARPAWSLAAPSYRRRRPASPVPWQRRDRDLGDTGEPGGVLDPLPCVDHAHWKSPVVAEGLLGPQLPSSSQVAMADGHIRVIGVPCTLARRHACQAHAELLRLRMTGVSPTATPHGRAGALEMQRRFWAPVIPYLKRCSKVDVVSMFTQIRAVSHLFECEVSMFEVSGRACNEIG